MAPFVIRKKAGTFQRLEDRKGSFQIKRHAT